VGFEVLLAVDFRKVAEYALVVELFWKLVATSVKQR
jgi:hypothetical protein